MYIVVAEAKKLSVIDYLIVFSCELFSYIDTLKEVINGCGWISTCIHAIKNFCGLGGGDGYVLSDK